MIYRKSPKFSETKNVCCNHAKVFPWNFSERCRWNGKQCRPWSDCSTYRNSLIWVCSVCQVMSVEKFRTITVLLVLIIFVVYVVWKTCFCQTYVLKNFIFKYLFFTLWLYMHIETHLSCRISSVYSFTCICVIYITGVKEEILLSIWEMFFLLSSTQQHHMNWIMRIPIFNMQKK